MKARTLKLKTLAIASAVTIAGCTLALSPSNVVIAAEAPVVTQQVAKMTNAQLYAGLEITQDPRYICVNTEAWGTSTVYYLPNRVGYTLDTVVASTTGGKLANYKFFCPLELDKWGAHEGLIQHTGGAAIGQAAPYALRIIPEGTTVENGLPGDIDNNLLQQLIIGNPNFTGYMDLVDEGNTIRLLYSISFSDQKGYYCIVEDKSTKNTVSFQYTERVDLYDDIRALTVIYSCLPQ